MRRKFAMIAAFLVAMTGALATKASKTLQYYSASNCTTPITTCDVGTRVACGVLQTNCDNVIFKK
jgi:hypothetical protein